MMLERDARVKCFGQGWSVIEGGSARCAHHRDWGPGGQRQAQRMMGCSTFINAYAHMDVWMLVQGKHERRIS